jgi:hypothetical protein
MSGKRVQRREGELLAALRDQRELLRNAGERYDGGSDTEAKNLAVRLRVLLHDGGRNSRSLLGQLEIKENLPYLDTTPAENPPEAPSFHGGLCMVHATLGPEGAGSSRYVPVLDKRASLPPHPPQAFVDWWSNRVISDDQGRPVSRRDFVLWLADQDGGAHVDGAIGETYAGLAREGIAIFQPGAGDDPRFKDLVAPSVRQIAFEIEKTLDTQLIDDSEAGMGLRVKAPICSLSINETVSVGRNDPCPCGSELKTKRCFGMRQPRRRLTLDDLYAEAA